MLQTRIYEADALLPIRQKDVLRYMGCRGEVVSSVSEQANEAIQEINRLMRPRAVYLRIPIEVRADAIDFGFFQTQSRSLALNLSGCAEAYLFAATIGAAFDRRLMALSSAQPASAHALDAAGSAAVEAVCDTLNDALIKAEPTRALRPRYSPGYGDLSLSVQTHLLRALDCARTIGVTLSESCLLLPTKSVTAIIGIGVAYNRKE